MLAPLVQGEADAVFGSRMLAPGGALRNGMPLPMFLANRLLASVENRLLHANLSEFHSGYRAFSVQALEKIPFERNTNDFHVDTEIIVQLTIARQRIAASAQALPFWISVAPAAMWALRCKRHKQCSVTGVDNVPIEGASLDRFYLHDLAEGPPDFDL